MRDDSLATLPFVIQACGRFSRDRVTVIYNLAPRPTTPELEAAIAAEWDKQSASAAGTQRVLFNGQMLRYIRHAVRNEPAGPHFELTTGPTCYRDFVGTNLYGQTWLAKLGWDHFSNPIGTTATLVTSDNFICYGRRSTRVAYHAGHVHTFGGALEANDRGPDGKIDVFGSLLRELREELGIIVSDIADLTCVGLIRDKEIHQPELLFEARVNMSAADLRMHWQSAECGDEHEDIVTLRDESQAIVPFIKSCSLIAPVAIGALFIHGKLSWGDDWFADAAGQI